MEVHRSVIAAAVKRAPKPKPKPKPPPKPRSSSGPPPAQASPVEDPGQGFSEGRGPPSPGGTVQPYCQLGWLAMSQPKSFVRLSDSMVGVLTACLRAEGTPGPGRFQSPAFPPPPDHIDPIEAPFFTKLGDLSIPQLFFLELFPQPRNLPWVAKKAPCPSHKVELAVNHKAVRFAVPNPLAVTMAYAGRDVGGFSSMSI